jgi:type II secretory pathway pseudopilin PulG
MNNDDVVIPRMANLSSFKPNIQTEHAKPPELSPLEGDSFNKTNIAIVVIIIIAIIIIAWLFFKKDKKVENSENGTVKQQIRQQLPNINETPQYNRQPPQSNTNEQSNTRQQPNTNEHPSYNRQPPQQTANEHPLYNRQQANTNEQSNTRQSPQQTNDQPTSKENNIVSEYSINKNIEFQEIKKADSKMTPQEMIDKL